MKTFTRGQKSIVRITRLAGWSSLNLQDVVSAKHMFTSTELTPAENVAPGTLMVDWPDLLVERM